jgi:hypothetical protein
MKDEKTDAEKARHGDTEIWFAVKPVHENQISNVRRPRFVSSSFILHPDPLRAGATGSTSDFESEDEGSIPSPAAIFSIESTIC